MWDAVTRDDHEDLLGRLPTVEIRGIGLRLVRRLMGVGIRSMRAVRDADAVMLRNRFSIVMMRTVLELRGTPCIPMEEERETRDQLIFSRSFSTPNTDTRGMDQVLGIYAQQASARLRRNRRQAKVITAWAMTNHYNTRGNHRPAVTVALPGPTADPLLPPGRPRHVRSTRPASGPVRSPGRSLA